MILLFYLRVYAEMTGKKHNQAIKKTKSLGFTKIPPPFFKQPRRTKTKAAEGYTNFNTAGAVSLCFDFFSNSLQPSVNRSLQKSDTVMGNVYD